MSIFGNLAEVDCRDRPQEVHKRKITRPRFLGQPRTYPGVSPWANGSSNDTKNPKRSLSLQVNPQRHIEMIKTWLMTPTSHLPSISLIEWALASSRAVTHFCLSTSELAFRWNVWVPPLLITKQHESSVCTMALIRFIVPRHVCPISVWLLKEKKTLYSIIERVI